MNEVEVRLWSDCVSRGTTLAMANLSMMLGREISIQSFELELVALDQVAVLAGGPEALTVGVSLTASGDGSGHIMLMFDEAIARCLVDMLMGQALGTTPELGEFEASALGEIGNIVGSALLNTLSDATGLRLMPSTPDVIIDMAGALVDIIAVDAMLAGDEAFIAQTTFGIDGTAISGAFFVVPEPGLVALFAASASAAA